MKVLLISALRGLDPPCGDITYTEVLLKNPPEGVVYETYSDALQNGGLVEHARRERFLQEPVLTLISKLIHNLRGRRLLFWESFRFFSIKPGEYDLVHLHVFNARFLNIDCPLVISSGAPQKDLYLDRRHYSKARIQFMEIVDHILGRVLKVNRYSYEMPQAQQVIVYTEYYRDYFLRKDLVEAKKIAVIPILLPSQAIEIPKRLPRRIGFVAYDFDLKGGKVLLEAFEIVRRSRPDAELWIVGSTPRLDPATAGSKGITWIDRVPREQMVREIMPNFDVFAYPTPHDCFSYVMLEAMSCGLAIATSDYVSMPEAVDYGKAGLISPVGNSQELAENILTLLDPDVNYQFRLAARKRFEKHFSWEAVAPRILNSYKTAQESYLRERNDHG